MKIQEIRGRTGLTKRTSRFYAKKELVFPQVIE